MNDTKEKNYINYETGLQMNKKDWFLYYLQEIDKAEYPDFVTWWADMKKMNLITAIK